MATTAERIQYALDARGMKQIELSEKTGIGKSSISTYLTGEYVPKQKNLYKIAAALDVSESWLMGCDVPMERVVLDAHDVGRTVNFRIMNAVKCGYGAAPVEDYSDDYEQIPANMMNGYAAADCKVVRVTGSSMYPRIIEGDRVLLHVQSDVESGDVALILYNNGEEATLKKVVKHENYIELVPANPEYQTKRIMGNELMDCRIYGKVIKLIRDF